jgi:type I restriction enzyme R subunit
MNEADTCRRFVVPKLQAARWDNEPHSIAELIAQLAERGITFEQLAEQACHPDADPFDLLCHLAFNAPLRTRRERAQRLRSERKDFFEQHGPEARQILDELLETTIRVSEQHKLWETNLWRRWEHKYAEHGAAQFVLPDVLKVPPVSDHGQIGDITKLFGGADKLRGAVNELQTLLYAA